MYYGSSLVHHITIQWPLCVGGNNTGATRLVGYGIGRYSQPTSSLFNLSLLAVVLAAELALTGALSWRPNTEDTLTIAYYRRQ